VEDGGVDANFPMAIDESGKMAGGCFRDPPRLALLRCPNWRNHQDVET